MAPFRSPRGRSHRPASAVTHRFQVVIGLNDLTELVLRRPVAAVHIRMVALHQVLELVFHLGGGGIGIKTKHVERLALRVMDGALLRLLLSRSAGLGSVFPEQAERIVCAGSIATPEA